MNKKVYILGGGTVSHLTSHLALAAPAYGETAQKLYQLATEKMPELDVQCHLTRMAGGNPALETNEDIGRWVEAVIKQAETKIIFFNPAMVDFNGFVYPDHDHLRRDDALPRGKYATRLKSNQEYMMSLEPADKVLDKIRKFRKDITLVAFKTTCGATEQEQYLAGLNLLKRASCNLVLANDVKTRVNMIITPEEARYHVTTDRDEALKNLVDMAYLRSHLTFTRSTVVSGDPVPWNSAMVPASLRAVVNHCISRGAYKPFRGATVGHFAARLAADTFLTSKRKTNFNNIDQLGLVLVKTDGPDQVIAYGAKPSVGGQSQRIVFEENPQYDCIVHFHCPIKPTSVVPTVSQREFECGSHECGENTSRGLGHFVRSNDKGTFTFKAVYLDQHGPNIVFHREVDPQIIAEFIEENFDLEAKTGGYVT